MLRRRSIGLSVTQQTSPRSDCGLKILVVQTSACYYKMLGVLRIYSIKIQNKYQLRQLIIEEWERLHQRVIDNAVKQWRRCLLHLCG